MKKANKIFSVMLALALVFAMAIPAFAAEQSWTGSITINSSEKVSVNGKTFKAYKILDAVAVDTTDLEKGVLYTIPAALQSFYDGICGGEDSKATIDELSAYLKAEDADLQAFAVAALAAAKTAGISAAEATGANDEATFSELAFGYYVIEDEGTATPISALMLRTSSVDVTIKADKPSIKKEIDGDNDEDIMTIGLVDYNTAAVGDKVPYVLTSKVPAMTGYTAYTYTVTDEFSAGLTFNKDVKVTVDGADYTAFTVNEEGQTVTIDFTNFIALAEKAGKEIKITYSATVNDSAVMGVEGNPNAVTLKYSNNPQDNSTFDTQEDETRTYLVDLVLNKVDGKGNALAGAEFELKQGSKTLATGVSASDGKVVFKWTNEKGLKDGETYTITETKAPAGYNEADDITFKVNCKYPDTGTDCEWSSTNNKVTFVAANNDFETTVENLTGSVLPETGGIGTTIFYVAGAVLMFGAAVILITKKRMSCEA